MYLIHSPDYALTRPRAFAGLVHILGDAVEGLADPCLGWPDFPWAMAITTFATLFTFNFEWLIHRVFTARAAAHLQLVAATPHAAAAPGQGGHTCSHGARDPSAQPQPARNEEVVELKELADKADSSGSLDAVDLLTRSVQSCTLEAGIIFHSIFVGISLGLNSEEASVRSLMVALMFHQFNEGIAIGIMFIEAEFGWVKYWALGSAFFLTTPIGIAIGIGLREEYNPMSKGALGTEGVLNAISAGILLYNALVDFIVPTFTDKVFRTPASKALGFGFLYLGAAVMCLIAKWA
jgi:solute carrier family 39 (zinc transporter), member 1/2/3